jgi:hypothetical protein
MFKIGNITTPYTFRINKLFKLQYFNKKLEASRVDASNPISNTEPVQFYYQYCKRMA